MTDTIYLKEEEVLRLYRCDVSYNKNLENVRDAFVIACYTGLRFGDFSTLKSEHLQEIDGEIFIKKVTQKTGEEVIIPINRIIIEILAKYKSTKTGIPKVPCNPVFNKQIKAICKKAELNEKGRLAAEPEKELSDCISSHCARRTFATNAYLVGVPTLDIMRLTSHRTEASFLRYVRLGRLHAAQRFSKHIQMTQSKSALRVAN